MKLSLKSVKAATGVGAFVEKDISFRDKQGEKVSGKIKIKILSHDEVVNATDVFKFKDTSKLTFDHFKKALVFHSCYEDEDKQFFSKPSDIGTVPSEFIEAVYIAADEVMDFSGKEWICKKKMNSSASLSSTESVDEPLLKQEES